MDIHVSDTARREATKCQKKFSCLEKEINTLCKVESCIDGTLHFIQCLNKGHCSYQLLFGYRFMCGCPVRKEIFNKYKI
jgi:hypothetical protein